MNPQQSGRARARAVVLSTAAAICSAAAAAGAADSFVPTRIATKPDRDAGLQAFAQLERVLLHPRCVNCHVPDAPLQGNNSRVHYPPIQRGVDGRGTAPLQCSVCHSTQNSSLLHAPPGLGTDGKPGWHMPPANMKMSWLGLTGPALCKVFRDPKSNGDRSLAAIEQHMIIDHLVAWGWNPGPGRTLPPLDKAAFDEQVRRWIQNGAPCDSSEPLRKSVGTTRAEAKREAQQQQATSDRALVDGLRALAAAPPRTHATPR